MELRVKQVASITGEDYNTTLHSMIKEREQEIRKLTKELVLLKQLQKQ